ncbi:MAG: polysaccharide deacetylase family protein, partial [Bacillota bacterium]
LLVAPLPVAVMMGLWVTVFALTRYASVSWVASFGVLPLILYFVRRRDVFVIYGVLMSAMAVIQMAGGLARISEGRIVHSDDEGPFVDEGDENGENEDEPIRRKRTGLRVAAGVLGVLTALVWLGNQYVYHGFGVGVDVIRSGNPDLPVVALTFDDGPDPKYTPQILDILKRERVSATFFLVGKHVERFPGVARRIVEEGHCVGNHSYSHLNMPLLGKGKTVEEVERCEEAILRVCGVRPHLFRPPRGLADMEMCRALGKRGYTVVLWRLSSRDWAEPSWREIVSACNRASNGDIILFHDSGSLVTSEGGSRENTVKALPVVIRNLRDRGFRFVTVDELITLSSPTEP